MLKSDEPLSNFALNFNQRRYTEGPVASAPAGGPFDGYTVDANALGWAYACASSRAFRVAGPDRPAAMLPLIDVANHSFAPSAVVRPALGQGPGAIEMVAVGKSHYCPSRHPTHLESLSIDPMASFDVGEANFARLSTDTRFVRSLLELNDIL